MLIAVAIGMFYPGPNRANYEGTLFGWPMYEQNKNKKLKKSGKQNVWSASVHSFFFPCFCIQFKNADCQCSVFFFTFLGTWGLNVPIATNQHIQHAETHPKYLRLRILNVPIMAIGMFKKGQFVLVRSPSGKKGFSLLSQTGVHVSHNLFLWEIYIFKGGVHYAG